MVGDGGGAGDGGGCLRRAGPPPAVSATHVRPHQARHTAWQRSENCGLVLDNSEWLLPLGARRSRPLFDMDTDPQIGI